MKLFMQTEKTHGNREQNDKKKHFLPYIHFNESGIKVETHYSFS